MLLWRGRDLLLQGPRGPGSQSGCCSSSQPALCSPLPVYSTALVLGFDWGKFLKDHSYKAAPVSCFKHVSAREGRGGEGSGAEGRGAERGTQVLTTQLTQLPPGILPGWT